MCKFVSFGLGHYQYTIETLMKGQSEAIEVKRRYTEFEELYKLL